jgi:hypothetical protein
MPQVLIILDVKCPARPLYKPGSKLFIMASGGYSPAMTRPKMLLPLLSLLLAAAPAACAERAGEKTAESKAKKKPPAKPLIIVYPFVSKFDDGKLGAKTRECLRGHALRGKKLTSFDQLSEDELLAAAPLKPDPEASLEKVADHARDNFKAQYAAWGELTRAKKGKGYKLRALGASIEKQKKKGTKGARLIVDATYDCPNVHSIPRHIETFLARLLGTKVRNLDREYGKVVKVLEAIDINGDFSKPGKDKDANFPAGWNLIRPNLKPQVSWIQKPGGKKGDKCIACNMNKKTAAAEGIMLASDYLPVKKDAYYQASVEILSKRPKMIFWVRGYIDMDGQKRPTYRHQVRFYPEDKKRSRFERLTTQPFKPRNPKAKVEYIRVMIYAYHPAGKIYFDNAWLKRVEVKDDKPPKPAFVKEGGGEKL